MNGGREESRGRGVILNQTFLNKGCCDLKGPWDYFRMLFASSGNYAETIKEDPEGFDTHVTENQTYIQFINPIPTVRKDRQQITDDSSSISIVRAPRLGAKTVVPNTGRKPDKEISQRPGRVFQYRAFLIRNGPRARFPSTMFGRQAILHGRAGF